MGKPESAHILKAVPIISIRIVTIQCVPNLVIWLPGHVVFHGQAAGYIDFPARGSGVVKAKVFRQFVDIAETVDPGIIDLG